MYLFGVAADRLLNLRYSEPSGTVACNVQLLRNVSAHLAAWLAAVLLSLLRKLYTVEQLGGGLRRELFLWSLFFTPTVSFFYTMYYTDTGALLFVLAMYYASLHKGIGATLMATAAGAVAIMFRQTNVVWVAFTFGSMVVRDADGDGKLARLPLTAQLARVVRQLPLAMYRYAPMLALLAAMAGFIWANGAIVLGDKAHHQPVLHVAQLLYFAAFCTALSAPRLVFSLRSLATSLWRSAVNVKLTLLAVSAAIALLLQRYTLVHPFLLADNRHYTFYLWARLLGRYSWFKYAMLPPAMLGMAAIVSKVLTVRPAVWVAGLLVCTAAVLLPAHLVEPRYFAVPFMLLQLHSAPTVTVTPGVKGHAAQKRAEPVLPSLLFSLLSYAAVMMIFLLRPFTWPDGSTARFMW
eukprot:PLAT9021.5.p1 GENE.PLAT9021.5~~PLAT9021.5.p1  ORF type:complete len:407 (+),score=153.60 PLAT9021.5:302-1522(+)